MKLHWTAYIPNCITAIRFLLIYPILQAFFVENYPLALYLLLIAGCTDALDGQVARYYKWETQLGAFLDPLADKTLLISVFAALGYLAKLPWQISAIVISRDVLIMLGVIFYRIYIGAISYQAILISKINTVLQFLLIFCLLLRLSNWAFPQVGIKILMLGVTITSIASGIQYVWVWGLKVWQYIHVPKR